MPRTRFRRLIACCFLLFVAGWAQGQYSAYLFVYFTGNSINDESIHFAISKDGYRFIALNHNNAVINSKTISSSGGVRDPHILRSADGKIFYMVVTDMVSAKGWDSNRAMVLLKSNDLVHWTSAIVNIRQRFPGNETLQRVWAPQTIYDKETGKYMIYWSMKHGKDPDKIYYAYANADFTDLETEPRQLFFSPTNGACIDGDIIYKDGKYHLFFKTEGAGSGIKIAVCDKLTSGYTLNDRYVQQTKDPVEGSGVFKLNDKEGYILMYDVYTKGRYQFTYSKDLVDFKVVDKDVLMNFHPRHGTVMPITSQEANRLLQAWGTGADIANTTVSAAIRKGNTCVDTISNNLYLSVKPGYDLHQLDAHFFSMPGIRQQPVGPQDFSKGPVKYSFSVGGKTPEQWNVYAQVNANPVLDGLYADPDILFSQKTKRYYIYPTSDGFNNWSGTFFKTFSSPDLVHWKDEGTILDLEKHVSWAKRNAWAPTAIEKKQGNGYKYYFYFTAAQKIGVAVADDPAGPFTDSGKPLIDQLPAGITHGQTIDPVVFADPVSGKNYLYWGNGFMACAELADDMVSLKPGTTRIITPDATFREGTYVFYRKGRYYFMWSEDDTRSENYRVRYGFADAPQGPIHIPANNIVLQKSVASGIYATGHNSVIQAPGKDEWYMVYHRFNYPNGIQLGHAAGYNREVCIDKLQFNADSTIRQVIPTHTGILPKQDFHSWAASPPMGWNSWDCFGPTVTEKEVKANADYMAAHLKKAGWEYIVVDIRWYVANDKSHGYNQKDPQYNIDPYGRLLPAENRFPSSKGGKGFKPLADYLHSKGLKFGIHIMRGIPVLAVKQNLPIKGSTAHAADIYSEKDQCKWLRDMYTIVPGKTGSQEYYNSLFELYASWGLDFVKVDDLSSPIYFDGEVEMIRQAIDRTGRKIVLSTSPGETPIQHAAHVQAHANMWRTVGDFWDNWKQLKEHFEVFERWNPWRSYGAYPDGDMLPLGRIGIRAENGDTRMTAFNKDEQYTLMTLWSIFKSPLMFGGNLPDNDAFTDSLITNQAVLDVLKKSANNKPLFNEADKAAWIADDPASGAKYLAVFNKADRSGADKIPVNLKALGFNSRCFIKDLWTGKELGAFSGEFAPEINKHGAGLYRVYIKNQAGFSTKFLSIYLLH